jgi:SAM-dependent methyltransferase
MWPRTIRGEAKQRELKRTKEARILVDLLRRHVSQDRGPLQIFEFGAGAASQASVMRKLGSVFSSDVYIDPRLRSTTTAPFLLCDVARCPFSEATFDLIFSNHVIEHLDRPAESLRELQRIGKPECVYALAVPTSVWLVLSIPCQYRDKALNLWMRFTRHISSDSHTSGPLTSAPEDPASPSGLLRKFLPHGHGVYPLFGESLMRFRARAWRAMFRAHGFRVIADVPVLCYAPAGWPIIPTNRTLARVGLCSSRLFLLKKGAVR